MNLVTKEKEAPYRHIHETLTEDFTDQVKEAYRDYFEPQNYPVLPDVFSYIDQFFDEFVEVYFLGIHSMMRDDFPESRWENYTDEEFSSYEEMASYDREYMDDPLMNDIISCCRRHQLFTIVESRYFDPFRSMEVSIGITEVIHSPIQEVW